MHQRCEVGIPWGPNWVVNQMEKAQYGAQPHIMATGYVICAVRLEIDRVSWLAITAAGNDP